MQTRQPYPLGEQGQIATYQYESSSGLPSAVVQTFTVTIGSVEEITGVISQWMCLRATKSNGEKFAVWLLSEGAPSDDFSLASETTSRYSLQIKADTPLEFQNKFTGKPVLPVLGAWQYLFPKPADKTTQNEFFPQTAKYLGHTYHLTHISESGESDEPPDTHILYLRPDVLIGPPQQHKTEG